MLFSNRRLGYRFVVQEPFVTRDFIVTACNARAVIALLRKHSSNIWICRFVPVLWFSGSLRGYCDTKMTSPHDVHDIATIRTHARVCMIMFSHKTHCEKCNVLKITLLNHRAMYEYKLVVITIMLYHLLGTKQLSTPRLTYYFIAKHFSVIGINWINL